MPKYFRFYSSCQQLCSNCSTQQQQSRSAAATADNCLVSAGICSRPCQELTCNALAGFFNSTYNATMDATKASWLSREGWTSLSGSSCSQVLSAAPLGTPPPYCSWFGVICCSNSMLSRGMCNTLFAVAELRLQINGLSGDINSLCL